MKKIWSILVGILAVAAALFLANRARTHKAMAAAAEADALVLEQGEARIGEAMQEAQVHRVEVIKHAEKSRAAKQAAMRQVNKVREVRGDESADELVSRINSIL